MNLLGHARIGATSFLWNAQLKDANAYSCTVIMSPLLQGKLGSQAVMDVRELHIEALRLSVSEGLVASSVRAPSTPENPA